MRSNPFNRFLATRRSFGATRLAIPFLLTVVLHAQTNGIWTANASGNWSDPARWAGGIVADGSGTIADFSTLDITMNHTVTLDSPTTTGALILADNGNLSNFWTLAGTDALTLDNGASRPLIQALNQQNILSLPLAGNSGFDKSGGGIIVLSGDNSGLSGVLNLADVTGTNNAGLYLDSDAALGAITTINIGGSSASGQFLGLRGGRVVGPAVTLNLNSQGGNSAPSGGIRSEGAGALNVIEGPLNVTLNNARIANQAGARRLDITGPIQGGTNSIIFRIGDNEGIRITHPANSWSGTTTHSQGTLTFEPGALPDTSALIVAASAAGTVQTNGSFTRALGNAAGQVRVGSSEAGMATRAMGFGASGGDLTVNLGGASSEVFFNNFTTNPTGTATTLNTSIFVLNGANANGNVTFVNPLNLNGADRTIQVSARSAQLSGSISGANRLDKSGAGTLILSTANAWTGEFRMNGGSNTHFGITRVTHPEAFGPLSAVKNIVLNGSNRTVTVVELADNVTIDANKTLRISGKSFHDPSTPAVGDQSGLRSLSGDNAWHGDIIIASTGGSYGLETRAGSTLTLGDSPTTTKSLYNNAANDTRGFSFFGGGDLTVNLRLITNPTNTARKLNLFKIGSGKLTIPRGDNDFDQTPNLRSGITEIVSLADAGSPSSLGSGTAFNLGATLLYTGAGSSSNRTLGLLHTGGSLDSSGSGPLQLTGSGFSHQTGVGSTNSSSFDLGATTFTVNDPSGIRAGQTVTGTGIAAGTTVVSADVDSRMITISQPTAAAAANGVAVTFGGQNNLDRSLTLTGSNTENNLLAANLSNPAGAARLGIIKDGPGTWNLSGAKSYSGPTTVLQGKLGFSNSFPAASTVSVDAAATLALDSVVLQTNPQTGLALDIAGTLEINGPVSIALAEAAPAPGTYPVIQAGTITGNPALIGGFYRGASGSATPTGASLTISAGLPLVWSGEVPGFEGIWDLTTTANWKDSSSNPQMFHYGDALLFDDTSFEPTVTLSGSLRPASVTVHTELGYTFTGAGQLTGPFPLLKQGAGLLRLEGAHSFNGGITIAAGTLQPGGNQSLGANGQIITVQNGATLDTGGVMNANRDYEITLAGSGVDGAGAVVNNAVEHQNGFRKITLSDSATIGGTARWDLRPAAGSGSFATEVDLAGFTLTKAGTNLIAFTDGVISQPGGIEINEGTLAFSRMNVSGDGGIQVNTSGTLRFENYTTGTFTKPVTMNGGTVFVTGADMTLNAPVELLTNGIFDIASSRTLTLSNPLTGSGGLTRTTTAGLLVLAAENSYQGITEIQGGTLAVGTQTSAGTLGTGEVVNNGVLAINRSDSSYQAANTVSGSGAVTIGQTNGGSFDSRITLTGANTFTGNITVHSGGLRILDPSALGTGPKTIILTNGTTGRPQFYLDGSAGNITLPADFSFVTSSNQQSHPAIGNLGGDNIIEGNITLTSGGGSTAVVVRSGSLTLNGGISANVADRAINLGGEAGADGTVHGVISDGTHPVGVSKLGTNTWTLTGANTYTGATSVSEGTLLINGSQPAATGNLTVSPAATLGGSGTLGGTIIAEAGATLAPGTSIGTLTAVGALINGSLTIEINGTDADRFSVTGSLSLGNASLDIVPISAGLTEPVYIVASYSNLTGTFATTSGIPTGYSIDYNYNGLNQIALVAGSPSSPFEDWIGSFPSVTQPTDKLPGADPDGDGNNNLLEFALNGNPANPSANGFQQGRSAPVPEVGQALILTFAARSGANFQGGPSATADGITYTVRGSLDLTSFPPVLDVTEVQPAIVPAGWPAAGNGYQYHTFRLNDSTGLPAKGFLRLEVSE